MRWASTGLDITPTTSEPCRTMYNMLVYFRNTIRCSHSNTHSRTQVAPVSERNTYCPSSRAVTWLYTVRQLMHHLVNRQQRRLGAAGADRRASHADQPLSCEGQLLFCPHRETGQRQFLPRTARRGQPRQVFITQHCHLPVVAHRHRTPAHVFSSRSTDDSACPRGPEAWMAEPAARCHSMI